ncbi:MAG TPA: acetylxylan esterase [Acidobacteriota bacterium]|jgi:cephalosporin-C deacetylase-like acetyl esterase
MKRTPAYLFALFTLVALSAGIATSQPGEDLSVMKGRPGFPQPEKMLSGYLNQIAFRYLNERERTLAAITSKESAARRQAYVRERILQSIGGLPERTPLNPKTIGVLERDGYKIEKIIFESQPGLFVTANLYVPKTGASPYPAVLVPLGHELGAKAHHAWQRLIVTFAKNGFVVLTYDPIGQGERIQIYDPDFKEWKLEGGSTTEHTVVGIQCLLTGQNLARYTIWDGMRALDYLELRPEVDKSRIGCTGNSGGGTMTAYLSALDDRVKVAAPSCYITSWRRLLETIGPQDAEQVMLPFLLDGLDQADFVEAFAPKPYLILSAIRDFFPIEGARETFREARRLWSLLGAEEKLDMVEVDDGHGFTLPRRLAAYRWMNRWLKGVDLPIAEPEIQLESEEDLFCTPSGQVSVSLGGETVFSLNQKRNQLVRPQRPTLSTLAAFASRKEEIKRQVRRLAVFPEEAGPLGIRHWGELRRDDYRIEKLTYESEAGITVPALLFIANQTSGKGPAIVYVHDGGKEAHAYPGGELETWVKSGYVVLAIDPRGMGETRREINPDTSNAFLRFFGDYESAKTAFLVGRTLVGQRAYDIRRGLDVLETRPEVDAKQFIGLGTGRGAIALLHLATQDERIRKLALERMLVSYDLVVREKVHRTIFESIIPGVLQYYDLPDLAASLAGRQVWIINATDPLGNVLPVKNVASEYSRAQEAFRAAGAGDTLYLRVRKPGEGVEKAYPELLRPQSKETVKR